MLLWYFYGGVVEACTPLRLPMCTDGEAERDGERWREMERDGREGKCASFASSARGHKADNGLLKVLLRHRGINTTSVSQKMGWLVPKPPPIVSIDAPWRIYVYVVVYVVSFYLCIIFVLVCTNINITEMFITSVVTNHIIVNSARTQKR